MNDFFFDDPKRAIVVNQPALPQPWINYLSNGSFHAFVSQAGGGLAWWRSPVVFRLTRYRQYNLPIDSPGFYIYIRNKEGDVWSPTWRPCETPLDTWQCQHQPGTTTFTAQKNGVQAELTLFVPPDLPVLLWDLRLTALDLQEPKLDVFAYVEHSQLKWETESDWGYYCKLQLRTWHDSATGSMNYLYPFMGLCQLAPSFLHSFIQSIDDYGRRLRPAGRWTIVRLLLLLVFRNRRP